MRDIIEKGVAEAVTFPWGSIPLFGIDKVTKYHMDAPLYVTTFAFVFNKATYDQMSAAQKKVIDDHCTNEWAGKVAGPWADFEHAGVKKLKADPRARGLYAHRRAARRVAQGRRAAGEDLGRQREEGRRRSGRDHEGAEGVAREVQRGVLSRRLIDGTGNGGDIRRRCRECRRIAGERA